MTATLSNPQTHSSFSSCSPMFFIVGWSNSKSCVIFRCHFSLFSLGLEQSFLDFHDLSTLEDRLLFLVKCLSVWVFHDDQIQVMHLWQEYHRSDIYFLYPIKGCTILTCSKLVMLTLIIWFCRCLSDFSTYLFPFAGNKKAVKKHFELCKYSVPH